RRCRAAHEWQRRCHYVQTVLHTANNKESETISGGKTAYKTQKYFFCRSKYFNIGKKGLNLYD
ncbi:MAG: hypothetical protein II891_01720, partial [Bacteroidales bacterium]|nr:hypothetical protein [Bacteroidales bacterium]